MPVSYKWVLAYFVLALDCTFPVLEALFYRAPLRMVFNFIIERVDEMLQTNQFRSRDGLVSWEYFSIGEAFRFMLHEQEGVLTVGNCSAPREGLRKCYGRRLPVIQPASDDRANLLIESAHAYTARRKQFSTLLAFKHINVLNRT